MLAMLVASRGPIPVNVVKNAGIDLTLKKTDGFKDFNAEHRRHLEFVQRMCVGSLVDVGLLQFSHKSFADWLEDDFDENESYCVDREDGEKMLAEECWNPFKTSDTIDSLKEAIEDIVGLPSCLQQLLLKNEELQNCYDIENETVVCIQLTTLVDFFFHLVV